MKVPVFEIVGTKCPHPAFGHLLPSCGREKAMLSNIRNEVRRRVVLH
jgi:hypothetical protein